MDKTDTNSISFARNCDACNGTGLIVGNINIDNGVATQCSKCNGAGWYEQKIEYTKTDRKRNPPPDGVTHVEKKNTWECVLSNDVDNTIVPVSEWLKHNPEQKRHGLRRDSCPLSWIGNGLNDDILKVCMNMLGLKSKIMVVQNMIGESYKDCECYFIKDRCWELYDVFTTKGVTE